MDVKTVHGGGPAYRSATARDQQSGAVAHRAARVDGDYAAHARRMDAQYSPPGTTPIYDRLRALSTRVSGLVVGQYGEASEDVHGIAEAAADALAAQRWRLMGARSPSEARAYFVSTVRREMGLAFVIAMARHRLQREPFVGMTRAQVRAMRDARGLTERRARTPALPDQWVYDFYRHQAPGGRGEMLAARA